MLKLIKRCTLLVVDIHGDFKAKTDVTVFRCFPFHENSPHNVKRNRQSQMVYLNDEVLNGISENCANRAVIYKIQLKQ